VSVYLYTYRYVTRVLHFTIVPHRSRTEFNKRKENSTLNAFKFYTFRQTKILQVDTSITHTHTHTRRHTCVYYNCVPIILRCFSRSSGHDVFASNYNIFKDERVIIIIAFRAKSRPYSNIVTHIRKYIYI